METTIEEKICIAFGIIVVAVVIGLAANVGISKTEVVECNKWNADAIGRPLYYVESWQVEQCKAHGIELTAPLRK